MKYISSTQIRILFLIRIFSLYIFYFNFDHMKYKLEMYNNMFLNYFRSENTLKKYEMRILKLHRMMLCKMLTNLKHENH